MPDHRSDPASEAGLPPQENGASPSAESAATEGGAAPADLAAEVAVLKAKNAELAEQFLRAQADMQNTRRRAEEEISKARKFAVEAFAESLLPVCDSLEAGLASLTHAVNLDDTAFTSSCASLTSSNAIPLGRGTFQYIPSSTASSSSDCPIRVKGSVNSAARTLESQINFKVQIGDGNFGQAPSLTLKNPYSVPAVAIFNLAWGLKRSSGHATTGNGTTATPNCTGCIARWNLASAGGGNNSVGSMGTSIPVAANSTATFAETLSDARNYVQVGLIMGGIAGSPTYINSFSDNKETGNTP